MTKLPYGKAQFAKSVENMMADSYQLLADWSLSDREREKLTTVVSYQRGTYDFLCYVRAEKDCMEKALAEIEKLAEGCADKGTEPVDVQAAIWDILDWVKETRNWRKSKSFDLPRTLDDLDDDWTKGVDSPDKRFSALTVSKHEPPTDVSEILSNLPEPDPGEEEDDDGNDLD